MLPRAAAAAGNLGPHQIMSDCNDQISAQPGDLLELDTAAAADAIRSRAIAGSVVGFDHSISNPRAGLVNMKGQLGRYDMRGSAAGIDVISGADVEAASWRDFTDPSKGLKMTNPIAARTLGFDKQLSRLEVYKNAAAVPECTVGSETDDLDGGVYDPKLAKAVWPAVAAAHFGAAARTVMAAATWTGHSHAQQQQQQQQHGKQQGGQQQKQQVQPTGVKEVSPHCLPSTCKLDPGKIKQVSCGVQSRLQLLKQYNRQKAKRQQQMKG